MQVKQHFVLNVKTEFGQKSSCLVVHEGEHGMVVVLFQADVTNDKNIPCLFDYLFICLK